MWLIYQRANLSQTIPRKYAGFDYFWGLFGKCAYTGEILVADKGFRTKAITELLEQNKNVKYLFAIKEKYNIN
nr:hypothetical protein [Mycoplasmopsis bovis]